MEQNFHWIGLNLKILSLTCLLLALWQHPDLLHKRWQVQALLMTNCHRICWIQWKHLGMTQSANIVSYIWTKQCNGLWGWLLTSHERVVLGNRGMWSGNRLQWTFTPLTILCAKKFLGTWSEEIYLEDSLSNYLQTVFISENHKDPVIKSRRWKVSTHQVKFKLNSSSYLKSRRPQELLNS